VNHATASRVYDHAGSLARMGNDEELFRVMVGYLARDGQRWMQILKAAMEAGDVPGVQQRAHSLKGLVSNFGAGRAFQAAAKTEDLARAKRIEDLPTSIDVLEKALGELMAALAPHLPDEHSS
jgi:HPt (histidine-containing phosphotransfer) domain-containing protein